MSNRNPSGINSPGVRAADHGASVIQMASRSSQLESIGQYVQTEIAAAKEHRDKYNKGGEIVVADGVLHKVNGLMEQLFIIADEVKAYERATAWQSKI